MQLFQKIIAFFTSLIMTIFGVSGVTLSQKAQSLRVVAYIVAYDADYMRSLDNSHFDHLTETVSIFHSFPFLSAKRHPWPQPRRKPVAL